jgi:hypothetical protein
MSTVRDALNAGIGVEQEVVVVEGELDVAVEALVV